MNDRSCSEAFKKVEEFRVLLNKSQERVVALEKEIGQFIVAMVDMDMEKHTLSKQIKEKEQKLQSSEDVVFKQAVELEALKVKTSALEKVIFSLNSLYFSNFCYIFKLLYCFFCYYRAS